jgi:hypothetical protein
MKKLPRAIVLAGLLSAFVVAAFATAGVARAEEVEPPSPALLGVGIAVAVGGGALAYLGARRFVDSNGTSFGDLALSSGGTLLMQVGGALESVWAWQLGESRLSYDVRGNLPLDSRRPAALGALAVGALALVAMYVGSGLIAAKDFSCAGSAHSDFAAFQSCAKDAVLTATIVDLAAGGVLLVAAPIAAYGLGYDSAAGQAGYSLVSLRARVVPRVLPSGGGIALVGRF